MTIRENISYGLGREVTDAEVAEVATQANAHGFISRFPEGYSTLVGERGIRLSGGQKARLSLLFELRAPRAVISDPNSCLLFQSSPCLLQCRSFLLKVPMVALLLSLALLIAA